MRHLIATMLLTASLAPAFAAPTQDAPLPRRGTLGLMLVPGPDQAPVVHGTAPAGAAAKAGLVTGDRILAIGRSAVADVPAFLSHLPGITGGESVSLTFERDGGRNEVTIVAAEPPRERGDAFTTDYGLVIAGGMRLRRLLTVPTNAVAPYPVVVIVQGVGCESVHNEPAHAPTYRPIIEAASRRGYATLRVEKPGTGDSEGGPCPEVDYETELAGYREGIKSAFKDPRLDAKQVHVFGHSMGGIMMPSLARDLPVASVMVYGTGFAPWADYEVESTRRQKALEGLDPKAVETAVEQARHRATHLYELGWPLSRYRRAHDGAAPEGGDPEALFAGKHVDYFRQISRRDLALEWARIDVPVLALYGASDFVSFEADHRELVETVNRAHPGRAELRVLPRADHWFRQADDFADSHRAPLADPYNPAVPEAILKWLEAPRG